jgi:hypothetical protein
MKQNLTIFLIVLVSISIFSTISMQNTYTDMDLKEYNKKPKILKEIPIVTYELPKKLSDFNEPLLVDEKCGLMINAELICKFFNINSSSEESIKCVENSFNLIKDEKSCINYKNEFSRYNLKDLLRNSEKNVDQIYSKAKQLKNEINLENSSFSTSFLENLNTNFYSKTTEILRTLLGNSYSCRYSPEKLKKSISSLGESINKQDKLKLSKMKKFNNFIRDLHENFSNSKEIIEANSHYHVQNESKNFQLIKTCGVNIKELSNILYKILITDSGDFSQISDSEKNDLNFIFIKEMNSKMNLKNKKIEKIRSMRKKLRSMRKKHRIDNKLKRKMDKSIKNLNYINKRNSLVMRLKELDAARANVKARRRKRQLAMDEIEKKRIERQFTMNNAFGIHDSSSLFESEDDVGPKTAEDTVKDKIYYRESKKSLDKKEKLDTKTKNNTDSLLKKEVDPNLDLKKSSNKKEQTQTENNLDDEEHLDDDQDFDDNDDENLEKDNTSNTGNDQKLKKNDSVFETSNIKNKETKETKLNTDVKENKEKANDNDNDNDDDTDDLTDDGDDDDTNFKGDNDDNYKNTEQDSSSNARKSQPVETENKGSLFDSGNNVKEFSLHTNGQDINENNKDDADKKFLNKEGVDKLSLFSNRKSQETGSDDTNEVKSDDDDYSDDEYEEEGENNLNDNDNSEKDE